MGRKLVTSAGKIVKVTFKLYNGLALDCIPDGHQTFYFKHYAFT